MIKENFANICPYIAENKILQLVLIVNIYFLLLPNHKNSATQDNGNDNYKKEHLLRHHLQLKNIFSFTKKMNAMK